MDMYTEVGILLAYAFGILVLYMIGYVFLVPVKMLMKLILNSLLGGLLILAVNWIGASFGIMIPLNILTSAAVGILGIPGAFLVFLLTHIL